MTIIELIGFIITMAAFFLLVAKQAKDERKRRQNPEAYEEEQEREHQEAVKDLLRSLNIEVPEDEKPASPPPKPDVISESDEKESLAVPVNIGTTIQKQKKTAFRDPYAVHKTFEHAGSKRRVFEHKDAYAKRIEQKSLIKQFLKSNDSIKQAVILKEVLGTPKGLE